MTYTLSKSDYKGGLYQQPTVRTVSTTGLPGKYSYLANIWTVIVTAFPRHVYLATRCTEWRWLSTQTQQWLTCLSSINK